MSTITSYDEKMMFDEVTEVDRSDDAVCCADTFVFLDRHASWRMGYGE